jgi:hypothetical protein
MCDFWNRRRVVGTGGTSFVGSYVVERLRQENTRDVLVPTRKEYDLRRGEAVRQMYSHIRPDIVIHLVAVVGGVGANCARPGEFFYDNLMMGPQRMGLGVSAASTTSSPSAQCALTPTSRRFLSERRPPEVVSGRDERSVRARQEDVVGSSASVPAAVRLPVHIPAAGQLMRFRDSFDLYGSVRASIPRHPT